MYVLGPKHLSSAIASFVFSSVDQGQFSLSLQPDNPGCHFQFLIQCIALLPDNPGCHLSSVLTIHCKGHLHGFLNCSNVVHILDFRKSGLHVQNSFGWAVVSSGLMSMVVVTLSLL